MASFLTRDIKDFDTRSNNQSKVKSTMQKNTSTKTGVSTKQTDTLMQVRRFMDLEKRSQALVDAGIIEQREHEELFSLDAEFDFEKAEFYLEKTEKRGDYLIAHKLQRKQDPYLQLPPEAQEVAKRTAEAYENAWKQGRKDL